MKEVTFLQKHSQKVLSWTSSPKIEDPGGRILSVLGVEQGGPERHSKKGYGLLCRLKWLPSPLTKSLL